MRGRGATYPKVEVNKSASEMDDVVPNASIHLSGLKLDAQVDLRPVEIEQVIELLVEAYEALTGEEV